MTPVAHGPEDWRPLEPPQVRGYLVDRLIGCGGMGAVWHAVRVSDGREVAIKVILGRAVGRIGVRFRREVQVSSRLAHPNVVRVLDGETGPFDGPPWMVLEYLEGATLAQRDRVDETLTARLVMTQVPPASRESLEEASAAMAWVVAAPGEAIPRHDALYLYGRVLGYLAAPPRR